MNILDSVLTQINLSKDEIALYSSLLNTGPQSASQLAHSTNIKRTYVYAIAQNLTQKGLISQAKQGNTTVFTCQSPDKLVELAEAQKLAADQARQSIENVLDTLKHQFALVESKPVVSYFEGIEGVKKVYLDTLKVGEPILALVEASKVDLRVYDWLTSHYSKTRVKARIQVRAIVASSQQAETYVGRDQAELRESKLIDSALFPFEQEINIYGTKVAIINHHKDSKLLGIIIDNPLISQTFRSWFELTWKNTR